MSRLRVQKCGRHIVVLDENLNPVGYCHYRWEVEPTEEENPKRGDSQLPIGYIYELQLENSVRGLGLASHVMNTIAFWVRLATSVYQPLDCLHSISYVWHFVLYTIR
jgi:hypothetical protein